LHKLLAPATPEKNFETHVTKNKKSLSDETKYITGVIARGNERAPTKQHHGPHLVNKKKSCHGRKQRQKL